MFRRINQKRQVLKFELLRLNVTFNYVLIFLFHGYSTIITHINLLRGIHGTCICPVNPPAFPYCWLHPMAQQSVFETLSTA